MARLLVSVLFSCLVLGAFCSTTLLSDRNYIPADWEKGQRAVSSDVHSFSIFLKQRNIDVLERIYLNIHDPTSPEWGKVLTIDEILDIVAPPKETVDEVFQWLSAHGVELASVKNYRDSLRIKATVGIVESLFNTELYYYTRVSDGKRIARQWGTANVDSTIRPTIDIVTGVDDFLPSKRSLNTRPLDSFAPEDVGYVIPETIRNVYGIPATTKTHANSSIALIEFQSDNSFNAQDLIAFQKQTLEADTKIEHIVGPYAPSDPDAESTLDVQYATAIGAGTSMWFWTVTGWLLEFSQAFFNTETVPMVVSMSWGWTDNQQCAICNCNGDSSSQYVARTNNEWLKIGARRVSLFAASGDQGAPGDSDPYCTGTPALTPIFPGDSPYVTSVGATMLVAGSLVKEDDSLGATPPICSSYQCATSKNEGVCTYPTALITTGGGFATYTVRPDWQSKEVEAYLKSGVPLPPASYYEGKNRAYPDVAGLGHNYLIYLGGQWTVVDGTSCSSPVWAAITGLLNNERLNAGKTALGFLAPTLYKLYETNPAAFKDQTTGNNKCTESCCSTYGYTAAKGWDPVTGLGTPVYPELLKYVMSLP